MVLRMKRLACLVLAALAVLACTGAALASWQPEEPGVPLYCGHGHGGGHHGGRGHHGSRTGTADTAEEPAYPWLFCPSKGCVDENCTDPEHFHYCSPLCEEAEHEHYCETEPDFACGDGWHRSGCGHTGTVVYSKGCTDDHHDCVKRGHYHHCSADCVNPAHEHFTICRRADGSVERILKTA